MCNILGIGCYYHDSSAVLMRDGEVVAAAAEERFSRKKHDTSFPEEAIRFCLQSQDLEMDQIDYIAFYEKPVLKFERFISQTLEGFPKTTKLFLKNTPSWFTKKLRVPKKLKKEFGYKGELFFIPHHLSHAANSFLMSPYKEAAVVNIDGVGEWATTSYGVGGGNEVDLQKQINFPDSLGLLYSTITAYLGFRVNNSEYKVMGLSPYGKMDRNENEYYSKLKRVIDFNEDGSFAMDMKYFDYPYLERMPSGEMCELLEGPIRKFGGPLTQRHKDIAAALQMIYEDGLFNILNFAHRETGLSKLVLGGGSALNSVANGKIIENTPFEDFWIPPAPGDGGSAMGAAAYSFSCILEKGRPDKFENPFLGPGFSTDEIQLFLDENSINYTKLNRGEKIEKAARMISEGKIISWFDGKMEWGPRALGARSILCDPTNPRMKEILNKKVKHREAFRPFAPVVCMDDVSDYFELENPPTPSEYMLGVYQIKEDKRSEIPSVVHVNGSGRLQALRREINPDYYDLVKRFGEISGTPVLINTSFNVRGEPIVCNPLDGYKCMMGTGIDALFVDKFLILKDKNKRDAWNSQDN